MRIDDLEKGSRDSKKMLDEEDPEYLADLNLFMVSSKEKSEDELIRVEKRLNEVVANISSIQSQIKQ